MSFSEQEIIRREKLKKIKNLGINPYPAETFNTTSNANKIHKNYEENKLVTIAGRIISMRIMGKASFFQIQDYSGKIQVYFNEKKIVLIDTQENILINNKSYNIIVKKLLDIGDFIGINGFIFKTKVGEISIYVKSFCILSKSLRALPIKKIDKYGNIHDGFIDSELRYRMRYIDLIINDNVRNTFLKRTKIFQSMRDYFNSFGYIEVETPILQSIPGGANAKPFNTYHNSLNIPLYLRIANELYLKRLIIGGFYGVYEFSKNFRNEGIDHTHNPEFTAMEIYIAYKDYNWMMEFTEKLLYHISMDVNGSSKSKFGEHEINWEPPYERISFIEMIKKFTNFDITKKKYKEILNFANSIGIKLKKEFSKEKIINLIFKEKCEKNIIQPTFITDYPIEMSPLSKKHRKKPYLSERFELIICSKELANSYSELNDPIDQKNRFENQINSYKKNNITIDYDFIKALEYGMPPTGGLGIGMDRLIMFLTNNKKIQEVLFFPQMRPT